MAEANSLPLLSQYSDVFTQLHEGKLQCIHYGMDRVALNRFILDSAGSTSSLDTSELITMVEPDRVSDEGSVEERLAQCEEKLAGLVSLQEEVNTLQRIAREKGISGGFLNIVGQASIQSPGDHGASVIHQLSRLMGGDDDQPGQVSTGSIIESNSSGLSTPIDAANDEQGLCVVIEQDADIFHRIKELMAGQWQSLGVDVAVCFIASIFAIGLVS